MFLRPLFPNKPLETTKKKAVVLITAPELVEIFKPFIPPVQIVKDKHPIRQGIRDIRDWISTRHIKTHLRRRLLLLEALKTIGQSIPLNFGNQDAVNTTLETLQQLAKSRSALDAIITSFNEDVDSSDDLGLQEAFQSLMAEHGVLEEKSDFIDFNQILDQTPQNNIEFSQNTLSQLSSNISKFLLKRGISFEPHASNLVHKETDNIATIGYSKNGCNWMM
jgi:hypothetical protein